MKTDKLLLILCSILVFLVFSESTFRDCLGHSDFPNFVLKGLVNKFVDKRFWKNTVVGKHFLVLISNNSQYLNKFKTMFDEVLSYYHKSYKDVRFSKNLLFLPEITTEFMLYSQRPNAHYSAFDDIISRSSEIFQDWFVSTLKSLRKWFDSYSDNWVRHVSEMGFTEVSRIVKCLEKYADEDFEDNLKWLTCLYTCQDLRNISEEFRMIFDMIPQCRGNEWLGDFILRIFMDFLHLDVCYFKIVSPLNSLIIKEGDLNKQFVKFQTFVSPGVHCFPKNVFQQKKEVVKEIIKYIFGLRDFCLVKVEMSTSNYLKDLIPPVKSFSSGTPRCGDGSGIIQVAMELHKEGIQEKSTSIELTRRDWNKTFTVPLVAVVDHKYEPKLTTVNFTLKMVADSKRLNSTKLSIKVIDGDSKKVAVCQSVNDPHLVTFDNLYYNNLDQGYFVLYRNKELPYEVQVIYQSCGPSTKGESCNCAVAVRSHDDVFVVDRCRLRSNYSFEESHRIMKVFLFANGNLNQGTRIFRKHGGLTYQVLLPHGTLVTIKTNGQNFLNVWIVPSSFDRNRTEGLCGTYNDLPSDDLQHVDGSLSETSKVRKIPPRDFINSWRVKPGERIFSGVESSPSERTIGETCRCSHQALNNISCKCGFDQFVESCVFNLGDEFSVYNISMISRKSEKTRHENKTIHDLRDINETFVSVMNFTSINLEETKYCSSLLMTDSNLIKLCMLLYSLTNSSRGPVQNAIDGCIDDMKITGMQQELGDEWKMSAVDAAKETCSIFLLKNPYYVLGKMGNILENETCANRCNMKGICVKNRCHCDPGHHGPDCSFDNKYDNPIFVYAETTYCDSRLENCSYIKFFGKNFSERVVLKCTARSIKATLLDNVESAIQRKLETHLVSPNQGVCVISDHTYGQLNSQEVTVTVEKLASRRKAMTTFKLIIYDSVCLTCDSAMRSCSLKTDRNYCLVDKTCYKNFENRKQDRCLICNVSTSSSKLTYSQDLACIIEKEKKENLARKEREEFIARVVVTSSFSIFVIVATAIVYIRDRKRISNFETVVEKNSLDKIMQKATFMNSLYNKTISYSRNKICENSQGRSVDEKKKVRSMSAIFYNNFHQDETRPRTLSETCCIKDGSLLLGCQRRLSNLLTHVDEYNCGTGGHCTSLFAPVSGTRI